MLLDPTKWRGHTHLNILLGGLPRHVLVCILGVCDAGLIVGPYHYNGSGSHVDTLIKWHRIDGTLQREFA